MFVDVTVLGLVGGAPGGETPRVADSSAAGAIASLKLLASDVNTLASSSSFPRLDAWLAAYGAGAASGDD